MTHRTESFCSLEARLAGAPMIGTATRVDVWYLLEYPHSWEHKAVEESHLPEPVKQLLSGQAAAVPNARVQLIKHHSHDAKPEAFFSVVLAREVIPVRYAFELPHYEALLDLDLAAVTGASPDYASYITSEPIYLVCTNGRRDACCASRGTLVYEKLSELVGPSVWQTTHIGGHRFAANLVCLPHGAIYGRVDDVDPLKVIQEYQQGRLYAPALRGRCCYDPLVQAAESFFHIENAGLQVDRYRLSRVEETTPGEWTVCFAGQDGSLHTLILAVELTADQVRTSCGSDQTEPVTRYHLEEYRRE